MRKQRITGARHKMTKYYTKSRRKKFIIDKEILESVSLDLHHIYILLVTSYCKSYIRFLSIIIEILSFDRNKQKDLKRKMKSSREMGEAAGIPNSLCGDKN